MTKWTMPDDLIAQLPSTRMRGMRDRIEQLEAAIIAALRAPDEAATREILRNARDGVFRKEG